MIFEKIVQFKKKIVRFLKISSLEESSFGIKGQEADDVTMATSRKKKICSIYY